MDETFEDLINSFKKINDDFMVILNGIFFNNYQKFNQYLEDTIEYNNKYYQIKIKINNYYEIPTFREKDKLIAYVHYKLNILDMLV